jgi:hypothetical protein
VWQSGVTHLANGDVGVPSVWAPLGTATVQLANVPSGLPMLGVSWNMQIDSGAILMDLQSVPPISQTTSMRFAPGAGTGATIEVQIGGGFSLTGETRTVAATGAPTNVVVDFSLLPVPVVSAIQQTANGAAWVQSIGNADVRTLLWRAALHTGLHVNWTLYEPAYSEPMATLPRLPAAHAALDPTVDAGAELHGAAIIFTEYDVVTGFTLAAPSGPYQAHSSTTETIDMQQPF